MHHDRVGAVEDFEVGGDPVKARHGDHERRPPVAVAGDVEVVPGAHTTVVVLHKRRIPTMWRRSGRVKNTIFGLLGAVAILQSVGILTWPVAPATLLSCIGQVAPPSGELAK